MIEQFIRFEMRVSRRQRYHLYLTTVLSIDIFYFLFFIGIPDNQGYIFMGCLFRVIIFRSLKRYIMLAALVKTIFLSSLRFYLFRMVST